MFNMHWKVFVLASGISVALANHTNVEHSGCSQSGSIQPIPYVPMIDGEFVNSASLYDKWKASFQEGDEPDLCLYKPDAEENRRGKEDLHLGDYLLIKWEFQSGSTLAGDPSGTEFRPSGFLREKFSIFIQNACRTSRCVKPAIDLDSGEVLFPIELLQEGTGVAPVLRYNSWKAPDYEAVPPTGIVVSQENPLFPNQPLGMGNAQWAITNIALTTERDIIFNAGDKVDGGTCLGVGTFVSALYPEIGSFQTKIQSFPDNGVIIDGKPVETNATLDSIMVIDSTTCSNVPPELETSISGVSQILMAKFPPPPSTPPPNAPSSCPGKCHNDCRYYASCLSTCQGEEDCANCNSDAPEDCSTTWKEECSTYYDCYYPCTLNDGLPDPERPGCTSECVAYLEPPTCSSPPCPEKCQVFCSEYATCISTGGGPACTSTAIIDEKMKEKCYTEWKDDCSTYYECYYGCTSNTDPPAQSESCSRECFDYLDGTQCVPSVHLHPSPPPFPPPFPPQKKNKPRPSPPPPKHSPFGPKPPPFPPQKKHKPRPSPPPPHMSPHHSAPSPKHSPPPEFCPHHCFDQCKDYASCMATLGIGCDSLAMSPMCYGKWEDECMMFYECYWGCTENKHKPKPSGSCSHECVSYLIPDCFPYTVSKDPHFQLPHGGRADFRGEHNSIFNLLSAKNMSMNVMITDADFVWNKRTVHGTKMSAAYWVVRTLKNKVVRIEYNTTGKGAAIYEDGTSLPIILVDEQSGEFVRDNLHVQFLGKNQLRVKTEKWDTAATKSPFPFQNLNKGKVLLDIEIAALYDADSDIVAPHGIFGQAYDGDLLAIDGAMDTERDTETSTKAQAEGAIEGTWTDYKMDSKFATEFKYARFDAASAKPRNVAKLTGIKHAAGKSRSTGKAVSVAL